MLGPPNLPHNSAAALLKFYSEINGAKLLTKIVKSTGSEKTRPWRTHFTPLAKTEVNSPAATTLENNEKFPPGG